ncbi:MAG: histidine kinase [Propionibacteriaceae bacterium]|jgi:signal transduction histidine kinase|nr:histidine kinase [Propionibacteriaceae bacterium]
MDRAADKLLVLVGCAVLVTLIPLDTAVIAAFCAAVAVASLQEVPTLARPLRTGLLAVPLALAVAWPAAAVVLPLTAYDLARPPGMDRFPALRWLPAAALVPLALARRDLPDATLAVTAAVTLLAAWLADRTGGQAQELGAYLAARDDLRLATRSLEARNRDLRARQDIEVSLATLTERARIARDIHDNVGHLLTRSILQVEALQVVRADDAPLVAELQAVGGSLHQGLDEVRAAVHALHAEAFDLKTELAALAAPGEVPEVTLDYDAEAIPPLIGQTLLAIAREAHSNAIRHSDATRVRVAVAEHPGFFQLTVTDNGSRRPAGGVTPGIGLTTMEERARALGGTLRTSFDHGYRVFCSIPKESAA